MTLGLAKITVTRTDTIPVFKDGQVVQDKRDIVSNVAKIDPNGSYVFVTAPEAKFTSAGVEGDLVVLNGDANSGTIGDIVARIPLEQPADIPYPRDVAITPDNTRAYVTLLGSGRVAVVDTVALQEIDVSADRNQLNIAPQIIAAPKGVAVDPTLDNAVLTDPTDIRGTININNLATWKLQLVSLTNGDVIDLPTSKSVDTGKGCCKQHPGYARPVPIRIGILQSAFDGRR